MPEGRDFLDRFRPAGAPGSAARAGVPADRARELADELDPVLALLDDTHAECERIVADAGREAERIMAAARSEAARTAADADTRARATRDEASRRLLAQAGDRVAAATTAAGHDADRARERAAQRLPALVAKAVALVRDGLDGPPGDGAGPS
ncbi:MAG: hypothetical protein ACM32E_03510 [Gemmatimonadota bacterium]